MIMMRTVFSISFVILICCEPNYFVNSLINGYYLSKSRCSLRSRGICWLQNSEIEAINGNNEVDENEYDWEAAKLEISQIIDSETDSLVTQSTNSVQSFSRSSNRNVALASGVFGSLLFLFQHTQPVSGIALLHAMERDSIDLNVAMCNEKPTIIEFYADWCESCKVLAPSMRNIEVLYRDQVNFITIDGVNPNNGTVKLFSWYFPLFSYLCFAS